MAIRRKSFDRGTTRTAIDANRSRRLESKKIGEAIKKYNISKLGNVHMLSDSKSVWAKVSQLSGRSKTTMDESHNAAITADSLNGHYAEILTTLSTWPHDSNAGEHSVCLRTHYGIESI